MFHSVNKFIIEFILDQAKWLFYYVLSIKNIILLLLIAREFRLYMDFDILTGLLSIIGPVKISKSIYSLNSWAIFLVVILTAFDIDHNVLTCESMYYIMVTQLFKFVMLNCWNLDTCVLIIFLGRVSTVLVCSLRRKIYLLLNYFMLMMYQMYGSPILKYCSNYMNRNDLKRKLLKMK